MLGLQGKSCGYCAPPIRKRLSGARRDLADPALHDLPIHRIATRWGFTDHATFTRAFHAANGIPPRDYRRRTLTPPPPG